MTIIKLNQKKTNIVLLCIGIIVLASMPLFTNFLMQGTKLHFQLYRIEALKEGLEQFGIMMWSKPEWIHPSGFSFGYLYGDTFLYIAVVLRLLGFSVQAAYRGMLLLVNCGTVIIAYKCFCRMWKDEWNGLLCTAVYSLSIYRCAMLYGEAELGEVLALMFVPLVLLGIYELYFEEMQKNQQTWLWLVLGFSGVLRSYIVGFLLTGLLFAVFMLTEYKVWRKKAYWLQIGKTVLGTLLVNVGYMYTALRYIASGQFVINPFSGQMMQERGLQIAQLFMSFYQGGASHDFGENGIKQAAPIGLGLIMLIGVIVFLYLIYFYENKISDKERKLGVSMLIVGSVGTVLSLLCFPWDKLVRTSATISSVVTMIENPWHFLMMATICFSVIIGINYQILHRIQLSYGKIYALVMGAFAVLCGSYLMANLLFTRGFWYIYTTEDIQTAGYTTGGIVTEYPSTVWYILQMISVIAMVYCVIVLVKNQYIGKEKD